MVDFSKKIKNSDKFRLPAIHFQEHGVYCSAPYGSTEYMQFWEDESNKCINGYTADDGDWVSGYNYFYLNYCPILRLVTIPYIDKDGRRRIKRDKIREFPDFYDYDYYFFSGVNDAEAAGQHMAVLKARGKGYSFKGASMLCRNYYHIPESKSYALASESEYLTRDGILSKAWDLMDFIDEHTAWAKKRQAVNTKLHRRASILTTDEMGNKIEIGYKSEIIGVSLKNEPNKARGKRGKLILFEEAGSFRDILQVWQIARPSVEEDGVAYGLMLAFGTGGDEDSKFSGLKELFYRPSGYNIRAFENIWDEGASGTTCGFFVPAYANMSVTDGNGLRLYMDKDGNTLIDKALEYSMSERQKVVEGASDARAIDRFIAENPHTPQEAVLELTGNIFPKKDLMHQLTLVRTNKKLKNFKQVGDLIQSGGEILWKQKKSGDITEYPLDKHSDPTGSIVIWEHPVKDAPHGLYIAGCLTPGEKVMTDIGLMNVEDIDHSRKLINKDGQLVNINTLLRYEKQDTKIYEVKVSNTYRTTTFTGEHPIYISKPYLKENKTIDSDKFDFNFIRMRDVEVGDWIKVPNIYRKNIDNSDKEFLNDPLFYKFLGMWLGDGWCQNDGKVYMAFNKSEFNYKYEYTQLVKKLFNKSVYCRDRDGSYECSFSMKDLNEYLFNNFGKGANGKYIPEWVKYLDESKKQALLLGYLDTDGCITKHSKGYYSMEYVSINLELLEAIQNIAFSIGLISSISKLRSATSQKIKGRVINSKACYHLRFGNYDTISFAQRFDSTAIYNTKLEKINLNDIVSYKRNRQGCFFDKTLDYIYFQIKEINESLYTGTVYNFDCETHTFMCEHITTHNCDPYDHDKAGTNSLGSTFIYKRFQGFEEYYDMIVAEYTGRPDTAEEYYENVRLLLLYYNAKLLYENERKGIFPYFTSKHSDYLLADQPDIISDIIGKSSVNRKKGIHMTTQIIDYSEGLVKEWLNGEYAPGHKNLERIMSEPLLEELIQYNDKGNFDRVRALQCIMLYKLQLHNVHVKKARSEARKAMLFDKPIFSKAWFGYSDEN